MLEWKLIKKHPPPKDGRKILLCDARIDHAVVSASWEMDAQDDGYGWHTLDGLYHDKAWTHWADIGPLPTVEPGHE